MGQLMGEESSNKEFLHEKYNKKAFVLAKAQG